MCNIKKQKKKFSKNIHKFMHYLKTTLELLKIILDILAYFY